LLGVDKMYRSFKQAFNGGEFFVSLRRVHLNQLGLDVLNPFFCGGVRFCKGAAEWL
jgi:hypothetical protein